MNYQLIKDVVDLISDFEDIKNGEAYESNLNGFKKWIATKFIPDPIDLDWEGKSSGRSAESVINTLIVHMNRYARTYSKSAIHDSPFSTQEEFIYLINLKAFGAMSKMELIKKNIQEKPVGTQIINRLLKNGWITQKDSITDKRSKVIDITEVGLEVLEAQMEKIRKATALVTGNLEKHEKLELIRLLTKLDHFHKPIYMKNYTPEVLLERITIDGN